jgi:nicotinamidase-related amidase
MKRGIDPHPRSSRRAAVIALDLLTDFDFPDGGRIRRALAAHAAPIRMLLARARANGVPVIYVNDNFGPWRSDAPGLIAHCTEPRRRGARLVAEFRPADQDSIVLKPRHSAFFGTPLAALLEDQRVDRLVIAGISLESCVWMTACDAYTRGFELVIPSDTVAGTSAAATRRTLASLREVLGAHVPARAASLRFARGRLR